MHRTRLHTLRPVSILVPLLALLLAGCHRHPLHPPKGPPGGRLGPDAIRLASRLFVPAKGMEKGLRDVLGTQPPGRERVHVLIQFERVPGLEERGRMARALGVELLDPVPERGFFAVIPANPSVARRLLDEDHGVRWIGRIRPGDKIAPWLEDGEAIPDHARRPGGRGELVVLFFGDVSEEDQRGVLERVGVQPLTRIVPVNGWRIVVEPRVVRALAAEDSVQWIEELPPPPQDDNDGVRSASGVDADAVSIPGTQFNLSGAGVTIAQWESAHASTGHGDFTGRIVVGDPPVPFSERSQAHDETVSANDRMDVGEGIYSDMDDSGTVSEGDVRQTPAVGFPAGTTVSSGDFDLGRSLVLFLPDELFRDTDPADFAFSPGEALYRDLDRNVRVSVGDLRLTSSGAFPAGSTVGPDDADRFQLIREVPRVPHFHATHTAGIALGSGSRSILHGGAPAQWRGVAPEARLRSYSDLPVNTVGIPASFDEYGDAVGQGATISTNSWGTSYVHQRFPPATGYDLVSQYYDALTSGRRSDGGLSEIKRILIFGSAGDLGRPERHEDLVAANLRYDLGETIYWDYDDDAVVSAGDLRLSGPFAGLEVEPGDIDVGTTLVNFRLDEAHDDTVLRNVGGRTTYDEGEGVYRDLDLSGTISPGDLRVTEAGGFPAGSTVLAGHGDVGYNLRRFLLWGNVRVPNSAKDTVEVGNIDTETLALSPSSGRGPTDDGRIKPDLVAPGSQAGGDGGVTSTFPGDRYIPLSGTSMSTPAAAGVAALVTQWYRTACPSLTDLSPETLRALLIHSAEDLTTLRGFPTLFPGPDFAHGFGRLRASAAVAHVPHHVTGTVDGSGDQDYTVTIGRTAALRATLAWDDPPWTANAAPSEATGILHNDLDLVLISPDGTRFTPWVADPTDPFRLAGRSVVPPGDPVPDALRDRRNTVEQVLVENAAPGTWTLRVSASTLNLPPQSYALVAEALEPQSSPCSAEPAADLWMRDTTGDGGSVPSSPPHWRSPDVWNRTTDDGMNGHQNPEYGQENYLYADVRNRSPEETVHAASVDVWIAQASTGLSWPDDFRFLGRFPVGNLGPDSVRRIGPLPWEPPMPDPSSHFCLYVRATSPQDPITFEETDRLPTNAANSNNIVWRNVNVVNLQSSRTVTFLVRNVRPEAAAVDLSVRIDPALLEAGRVALHLPTELHERWPGRDRPVPGTERLSDPAGIYAPKQDRWPERPERQQAEEIARSGAAAGSVPATASRPDAWGKKWWKKKPGKKPEKEPGPRDPDQPGEPDRPRTVPEAVPRSVPYRLTAPEVELAGFPLGEREASALRITFRSDRAEPAEYEVEVVQRSDGRVDGGVLYLVRTGSEEP